jgi:hypothetical protein
MDLSQFAAHLGFPNNEALMEASQHFFTQGDVDWWVTRLPDGRWAAWDDAELAPDRVEFCDTYEEAVRHHRAGIAALYVGRDGAYSYHGKYGLLVVDAASQRILEDMLDRDALGAVPERYRELIAALFGGDVADLFPPRPGKDEDWAGEPTDSGYRALGTDWDFQLDRDGAFFA